jgi:hypothetical protein
MSVNDQQNLTLPNLIIAGVNRSGTTSLFTYLSEHPQISASTIKETDYFAPLLKGGALQPIETYAAYFEAGKNCKYRMEASPRYIFGGTRIAAEIHRQLGLIRVLFVLRDPVARMISYFQNMQRNGELPISMKFDHYAERAIQEVGDTIPVDYDQPIDVYGKTVFARGLVQGFYADYLRPWYSEFSETVHVSFFEHLTLDPRIAVQQVCIWLGLDPSIYETFDFTQENRSIRHRNFAFFKVASHINQRFEPFWRKHGNLKRRIRRVYCRLNEEHPESSMLSEGVRAELERMYTGPNRKLITLLEQKGYRDFPAWLGRASAAPDAPSRKQTSHEGWLPRGL